MTQRGGAGANVRRAAAPSPPLHGPSSTTTFARTSSCASPSPGNARVRSDERLCMAFRMDAGQAGVKEAERAPRLAISVAKLGRRDAFFRYKNSAVTVRSGRSVWEVWLNVRPPAAVGGSGGPE